MRKILTYYLKPYYGRMALGFGIKFTGTVMDLLLPWTLAHMIDWVIPTGRRGEILLWGGFMVVCSFLAVAFNILANRMASRVASDAIYTVRGDLFAKVMYLSHEDGDRITRPSLISRLTSDTYYVHQMLARIQRLGVRAPILLLGGLAMTLILDPVLACVLLAVMPLLALVVVMVSKKGIPLFAALQDSVDRFVRLVREDIAGIRVIKALSKEDYERERCDKINRETADAERKATMTTAVSNPAMNIFLNLGLVGVIIVGAYRVNAGTSQVGKILAFMTYFTIILNAMMSISRMFVMISRAAASADRIDQVLNSHDERELLEILEENDRDCRDLPDQNQQDCQGSSRQNHGNGRDSSRLNHQDGRDSSRLNHGNGRDSSRLNHGNGRDSSRLNHENCRDLSRLNHGNGRDSSYQILPDMTVPHVEFDHVSFSYNKTQLNLSDISFKLKQGETLGIIGSTGSGKTTVINLLMGFYRPDQGKIRINGQDISDMDMGQLRRRFGTVFQNDMIFENTIFENITMGRPMGQEQAENALRHAMAEQFVAEKGGLNQMLDIRGANLSGGQKQRLLIARALAGNPEILILDDSSSALDYKTDAALRQELREHFQNTTCVIIAQRVSSVMSADHILVLEEGQAIGYGTHEELMESCLVYREIGSSQMGAD